ncbi:hypothetical protein MKW98_008219 [Papaver atlanticum]|uniref:non-specific serine/threonine protein kinase n=1 Tax=Papaver atlanticum TaxID=357466 RepID=A0AAD4RW35_9MAGN|nr:hypothetical protein MKW98_008219 [Papaver atlanticum]
MSKLKQLRLTGELPDEFANLPYLQEIDLNVNYLSGSIPKAWKTLPLVNLAMLANNIGGSIPKEIAEIVTLQHLVLQDNQFEGPLPPELGKLTRLTQLTLSGNNFTGVLPATFANLKNMADFRIAGTSISGKIPDFFGNWIQLIELDIRGTSMEGPIPSTIFHLKNLTKLRVSDLKGPNTPFPDFQDMNRMYQLELRNCLIQGSIPSNIGEMMPGLINLDLSFNRLTGDIHSLKEIPNLKYLYFTNNQLIGQIPLWITNTKQNFDLSYNNFTGPSLSSCQDSNLNQISSYPSDKDRSIAWCLKKDLPCDTKSKHYSFFINCGGSEMAIGDEKYEADVSPMGPSSFFSCSDKWACSTTGDFIVPLLNGKGKPNYLTQASPNVTVTDLYKTARISPFSLKYYGICLRPGKYKVKLHFAEIMFPIDKIASGIGTRIFDVSIQGNRYLKDFNIEEEAKGVGKSIIKEYDVNVTSSTLEIHLYWAGKGTNFIPSDFAYGPLISAIAVTPMFDPNLIDRIKSDSVPNRGQISAGVLVGTVAASCVLILLILAILWKKGCLGKKKLVGKGRAEQRLNLNWPTRLRICSDIAEGLAYLHEESRLKIVHRDIKASNVLLDKYFTARISDFGLAKLHMEEQTHISTDVKGTFGYLAPEYASSGHLTYKADIYSFGIVALEIVSGKSSTKWIPNDEFTFLLDWIKYPNNLLFHILQCTGNCSTPLLFWKEHKFDSKQFDFAL